MRKETDYDLVIDLENNTINNNSKSKKLNTDEFINAMFNVKDSDINIDLVKEKIQDVLMKMFRTKRIPRIYLQCYDFEYWFIDTPNPEMKDVGIFSYNELLWFNQLIKSGIPAYMNHPHLN